jgi:formylmethanofuran dehydrogenase subunit E
MDMRLTGWLLAGLLAFSPAAQAETPEEWAALGARVHGGFGAFIPTGIRIGLDAASKIKVAPRELAVTYYDNERSPCACFADGVALATLASVGQRSLTIATEKAPADMAAVIIIRPRKGGQGLRYAIPLSVLPRLAQMNQSLEPVARFHAVMEAQGLFEVTTVD